MRKIILAVLLAGLAACDTEHSQNDVLTDAPVKVRSAQLEIPKGQHWSLSGSVHSRHEAGLAFRLPGQIRERLVQAGEQVEAGQLLMRLDARDVRQQLNAAQAQLDAARVQADNAEASRRRLQSLREQDLVPAQAYENAEATANAALQAVRTARAAMEQARTATEYVDLRAPASGVLIEVAGEAGQVVGAGQTVARLAYAGEREVQAWVPETRRNDLPERAQVLLFSGAHTAPARLREVAGAADPQTRSWRVRYAIEDEPDNWPLGASVTLDFTRSADDQDSLRRVPLSALIDRGQGAGVWLIEQGQVRWIRVDLLRVDAEHAYVRSRLPAGTLVVALGTHLLEPGQSVEVLP
ncbi:MAG: efflux RND transporter periplasmic adaptor subunit [Halopseudomonas yangmingensis]|uniref:RND family efflux transporter, MFP subunit n=1 Tax=Halopseudomonas yangmingensis TaxID=1720063 RepID=A0A1I4RQ02_9GAMM|nr:efflux RND transporter periplasmic adaptor subunit [Halopseudomonas yangmingensis]SFM54256.1 RND family efflux transporter, MFP subunit [Halopseudomonas yangmingensis]